MLVYVLPTAGAHRGAVTQLWQRLTLENDCLALLGKVCRPLHEPLRTRIQISSLEPSPYLGPLSSVV